ncbi:hypothetical protein ACO0R3_000451 [Hanseniaspora guilliermondii]
MTSTETDDTSGLKDFKITKRSQKTEATKEINDNTVSLTFSSPFAKTNVSSRASSRQASRPTSKRSSKRISGFDLLEKSISGMFQHSPNKRDNHHCSGNQEKSLQSPVKLSPQVQESQKSNEDDKSDKDATDCSSDDSFGWQDVDAVADRNVYDENGKLQLYSFENSNDMKAHSRKEVFGNMNGAEHNNDRKPSVDDVSDNEEVDIHENDKKDFFNKNNFAYTKIDDEEQAKASRKTNLKVDNILASATIYQRSHPNSKEQVDKDMNESDEFSDDDADITHEDLTRNNQLNGMKHLLTDNEKFAYAGCVFLLLNELCAQLATRNLSSNMIKDKKLAKRLHNIQKDYGYWKEEIMNKIYFHMEFNEDEINMIEKLGLYPLEIEDLMKALKIQRKVFNPYNPEVQEHIQNKEKDQSTSEHDENDIKVSSMKTITDDDILEQVPENVVSVDSIIHERELEVDVPWSVICDLFLLFLSKGTYDARSRVILKKFAEYLSITIEEVNQFERRITETLELEQTDEQNLTRDDLLKKRRQRRSRKKMAYVGLATVGGSLVLGLSGGLLAPVIGAGVAAGLSTVGITGLSGFLTGVGGTATVAATSTAIGANIGGSSMSRRMGSVRTFEFKPLHNNRRLNLIISISGWMTGDEDDVRLPFSTVDPVEGDLFSLHWEPDILKSTGDTMSILASEAITQTIQQVLGATILTAFMGAIQLPMALSKLGYLIDNPWNVSLDRAWNSGILLAQFLMEKNLGSRPVTLVGFSLGSRVIYYCLKELAKKGCTGIIENVIILGAPVVYNKDELVMCRSVVAGRFVNGYSEKDWILGYLFRATAGGISTVAGLSPIENEGIENFDCSDIVNGHMGYRKNIPKILKKLGFSILSEEFVEIDDTPNPDREKKQKELLDTLKKLEDDEKKKPLKKSSSWLPSWLKPKKEEWQEMVKKDVVDTDTRKKSQEAPEHKPEAFEEFSNDKSTPKKTYISVPHLHNELETPTSPLTQEGETFSLKLNHSRPRFASGNIGFVLKNAGKSRTPSGLSTASNDDKAGELDAEIKTNEVEDDIVANEGKANEGASNENEDTNSTYTVEREKLFFTTDAADIDGEQEVKDKDGKAGELDTENKTNEVEDEIVANKIKANEDEDTNSTHTVERKDFPSNTDDAAIDGEQEVKDKEENTVVTDEVETGDDVIENLESNDIDKELSQGKETEENDLSGQPLTPTLEQTPNFNPIPPTVIGSASKMSGFSAESPFYTADDGNDLEDNYDDNIGTDDKIPNIIEDTENEEDDFHFVKPTVMSHDPSMSSTNDEMESESNSVKTSFSNPIPNLEGESKKSMESTISIKSSPKKKGKGKKKKNNKKKK